MLLVLARRHGTTEKHNIRRVPHWLLFICCRGPVSDREDHQRYGRLLGKGKVMEIGGVVSSAVRS